jgi:hypothetical protein
MPFIRSYFFAAPKGEQPSDPEKGPSQFNIPPATASRRPSFENRLATPARPLRRTSGASKVFELKNEILASWLHAQQVENLWSEGSADEGVVIKKGKDEYTCCPTSLMDTRDGFYDAVRALNVRVSADVLDTSICRYLHD